MKGCGGVGVKVNGVKSVKLFLAPVNEYWLLVIGVKKVMDFLVVQSRIEE